MEHDCLRLTYMPSLKNYETFRNIVHYMKKDVYFYCLVKILLYCIVNKVTESGFIFLIISIRNVYSSVHIAGDN